MSQDLINYSDSREDFARRFHQIMRSRGLELDHDLILFDENQVSRETSMPVPYTVEPSDRVTIIVPGLLGSSVSSLVAPLFCAKKRLTVKGYNLKVAWVSGRCGCNRNAEELRAHVLEATNRTGKPVDIIGYSKGCADAIHMLGNHEDTHSAVASLVSYAGAVHGTPLAESVPKWMNQLLRYFPLPGEPFGDGRAIADLRPERRRQWLLDHPLPATVRLASIVTTPSPELVSRILKKSYRKLSMANNQNDSQIIYHDAILPKGELLAVVNADHWAIALPISERLGLLANLVVDKNKFPRDILIQATIDHLNEALDDRNQQKLL